MCIGKILIEMLKLKFICFNNLICSKIERIRAQLPNIDSIASFEPVHVINYRFCSAPASLYGRAFGWIAGYAWMFNFQFSCSAVNLFWYDVMYDVYWRMQFILRNWKNSCKCHRSPAFFPFPYFPNVFLGKFREFIFQNFSPQFLN